jgi:hypothetical protein
VFAEDTEDTAVQNPVPGMFTVIRLTGFLLVTCVAAWNELCPAFNHNQRPQD